LVWQHLRALHHSVKIRVLHGYNPSDSFVELLKEFREVSSPRSSGASTLLTVHWLAPGSFQDFMAGMAHLEERSPAPAEVPTVKSEAALYPDLSSVPMDADVLEWSALNEMKARRRLWATF
jgi:hypothetical protein